MQAKMSIQQAQISIMVSPLPKCTDRKSNVIFKIQDPLTGSTLRRSTGVVVIVTCAIHTADNVVWPTGQIQFSESFETHERNQVEVFIFEYDGTPVMTLFIYVVPDEEIIASRIDDDDISFSGYMVTVPCKQQYVL
jgi:hypothetical protein